MLQCQCHSYVHSAIFVLLGLVKMWYRNIFPLKKMIALWPGTLLWAGWSCQISSRNWQTDWPLAVIMSLSSTRLLTPWICWLAGGQDCVRCLSVSLFRSFCCKLRNIWWWHTSIPQIIVQWAFGMPDYLVCEPSRWQKNRWDTEDPSKHLQSRMFSSSVKQIST